MLAQVTENLPLDECTAVICQCLCSIVAGGELNLALSSNLIRLFCSDWQKFGMHACSQSQQCTYMQQMNIGHFTCPAEPDEDEEATRGAVAPPVALIDH